MKREKNQKKEKEIKKKNHPPIIFFHQIHYWPNLILNLPFPFLFLFWYKIYYYKPNLTPTPPFFLLFLSRSFFGFLKTQHTNTPPLTLSQPFLLLNFSHTHNTKLGHIFPSVSQTFSRLSHSLPLRIFYYKSNIIKRGLGGLTIEAWNFIKKF